MVTLRVIVLFRYEISYAKNSTADVSVFQQIMSGIGKNSASAVVSLILTTSEIFRKKNETGVPDINWG